MKQTNVLRTTGTANLLKASVAAGVKRMVAESMVFAYGFGDHGAAAKTEEDVLRHREPESSLQETVDALRSLEVQLLTANEQRLIESIVLRYGFFYGAGPSEYMLKMLRRRMLPTANGAHGIAPWIHIDDAVSASLAAMERGHAGKIYNITDDEPVGMNEWLTYAALSLKAKPPFSIPLWLLRLISPYLATVFDTRLAVSNRKAKDELDWRLQYPTFREGLREVAAHV
jgi:nucleoside-diphosphate-sugar epimerase